MLTASVIGVTGLDCDFRFAEIHGAGGGTRYIVVSIPSRRNRANGHRTFALNGSSPAPNKNKTDHPERDNPFYGAGDRTRTGTPSLAVDFERRGFSRIWAYSEALKGTIHLAKRIKTM